jgi:hypothetical protein
MFDIKEPNGVPDQTTYITFFFLQLTWLQEIFEYLIIGIFKIQYNKTEEEVSLQSFTFFLV